MELKETCSDPPFLLGFVTRSKSLKELSELDFSITCYVGIWCRSSRVDLQSRLENLCPVFSTQVNLYLIPLEEELLAHMVSIDFCKRPGHLANRHPIDREYKPSNRSNSS